MFVRVGEAKGEAERVRQLVGSRSAAVEMNGQQILQLTVERVQAEGGGSNRDERGSEFSRYFGSHAVHDTGERGASFEFLFD